MTTGPWRTRRPLQSPLMSDADPSQADHAAPVPVAAFADVGEAEVVQAKLRAFGIEAFIDDQVEGGVLPVEMEGSVLVLVRVEDADDARQVLSDDEA
jgi:Putative prokaryotic signal transducing protein